MVAVATGVSARRRLRLALAGISLAYFMVLLDTTVLAVAEPDLIATLDTDAIGVGGATTAYTMALAAALVFGGNLADRLGPQRVFLVGSGGFGLVSLVCAAAPGLGPLLLGRVGLGLLAAAIIPSSMALLAIHFPDPAARARAISVWASVSGAAMAAGPVLGGWLVDLAGWRAVFLINVPISLLVLLLCRGPAPAGSSRRPLSPAPHLGLAITLASGTLAITEGGRGHWPAVTVAAAVALGCAVVTVWLDRRSAAPLIPGSLRRNAAVRAAGLWAAMINFALVTVLFSLPLLLPRNALALGVTLLPMTILIAVNPLLTARLVVRRGPLLPIRLGFGAFLAGAVAITVALAGELSPLLLGIGLVGCGLGVSWTLPPLVGYAVGQAPPGGAGAVGGLINAVRQVGATLGAATAGVALGAGRSAVPLIGAAVVCLGGLVGSLVHRPGRS